LRHNLICELHLEAYVKKLLSEMLNDSCWRWRHAIAGNTDHFEELKSKLSKQHQLANSSSATL